MSSTPSAVANSAMHQRLRPLDPENCIIIGRARTFRWMEADYVVERRTLTVSRSR